jgi:hypothetical protein
MVEPAAETAPPLTVTNEMVAQFMMNQQALNERLQDTTDQMNIRLQTLLAVTNDATTLARGTNTPLPTGTSTPLPTGVTGLNVPPIDPRKRPKHTTPHLERFTGEDESIYPIFRGLLEAKLRTDAQAIGGEYK